MRGKKNLTLVKIRGSWQKYLIAVGSILVLGSIGCIAERLTAARILAGVRLLTGVRPQVRFQVLQPGVGFVAALELCVGEGENMNMESLQVIAVTRTVTTATTS